MLWVHRLYHENSQVTLTLDSFTTASRVSEDQFTFGLCLLLKCSHLWVINDCPGFLIKSPFLEKLGNLSLQLQSQEPFATSLISLLSVYWAHQCFAPLFSPSTNSQLHYDTVIGAEIYASYFNEVFAAENTPSLKLLVILRSRLNILIF